MNESSHVRHYAWWQAIAVVALLIGLVASWKFARPSLSFAYHGIEAELLAWAASGSAVERAIVQMGLLVMDGLRIIIRPFVIVTMTLLLEKWTTQVQREPKDYFTAGAVQIIFLITAHYVVKITGTLLPLPQTPMIQFPEADNSVLQAVFICCELLIFLLALDFLHYWSHRAHHKFKFLWKFHAVHHSPTDLDALHNFLHPMELWFRYFTVAIPLSIVTHADTDMNYLVFAFLAVQNQLTHMNTPINFGPLGRLFVDNRYHFVHHSSDPDDYDRNFAGIFPIFDRLFGTYKAPREGKLSKTGFGGTGSRMKLRHYLLARSS